MPNKKPKKVINFLEMLSKKRKILIIFSFLTMIISYKAMPLWFVVLFGIEIAFIDRILGLNSKLNLGPSDKKYWIAFLWTYPLHIFPIMSGLVVIAIETKDINIFCLALILPLIMYFIFIEHDFDEVLETANQRKEG